MSNSEDERAAAGIMSNLSGLLITASLAMLAIEGALFAFVLGNRVAGPGYFVTSVLAFLGFVISIVLGGWGITQIAEKLAAGIWRVSIASGLFSAQAGFTFLGLLFFLISAWLSGKPAETEFQKQLTNLSANAQMLQSEAENDKRSDIKRAEQIENTEKLTRDLNSRLNKLESRIKKNTKKSTNKKRHPK